VWYVIEGYDGQDVLAQRLQARPEHLARLHALRDEGRLLLAGPYLVFFAHPPLVLACAVCAVASVGYSATLMLQQRLIALTPDDLKGHALGLHSSCMLAMQGVGAALAGAVAEWTSPAIGITVMAATSVVVTLALARGLRPTATAAPSQQVPSRSLGRT